MAMHTMLRRASGSIVPLAIRAVGTPRLFQSAISAVVRAEKGSVVPELNRATLASYPRFFSLMRPSSDDNLVQVLESEIDCVQEDVIETMPEDFPFKIQDSPGEKTITMVREFGDEIIKVTVDMPADLDEDDGEEDNEEERERLSVVIPMLVSISKGSGPYLEVGLSAFPDEITIDSVSMKHPNGSEEDDLLYEGPEFSDLDENLQHAIHKYVEVRGIKPSTTNLLFHYMAAKDNQEYVMWLKNLKHFVLK